MMRSSNHAWLLLVASMAMAPSCTKSLVLPTASLLATDGGGGGNGLVDSGIASTDAGKVEGSESPRDAASVAEDGASLVADSGVLSDAMTITADAELPGVLTDARGKGTPDVGPDHLGCPSKTIEFNSLRTTEVMFVVGRNSSMATGFGATTRIQAVQDAIARALDAYPYALYFGYLAFPSVDSTCAAGCCAGWVTRPTFTAADRIRTELKMCDPAATTQSCVLPVDAHPISAALGMLNGVFTTERRNVILFTDGPPGCSSESTSQSCLAAKNSVEKLAGNRVKTYVVSLDSGFEASKCLNELAQVGGGGTGSRNATDPGALTSVVDDILDELAEEYCTLFLKGNAPDGALLKLLIDGIEVPRNAVDGWSSVQDKGTQLVVHGGWCKKMQGVDTPVRIEVQEVQRCTQ